MKMLAICGCNDCCWKEASDMVGLYYCLVTDADITDDANIPSHIHAECPLPDISVEEWDERCKKK